MDSKMDGFLSGTLNPIEVVNLINEELVPKVPLTSLSLAKLVSKGEIPLFATNRQMSVQVVANGEILLIQYDRIKSKAVTTMASAISNFTELRELFGKPMYLLDGEITEVGVLWDPEFKVSDVLSYISSAKTVIQEKEKPETRRSLGRGIYQEMLTESPGLSKDSAAPTIAERMGISFQTARDYLQGD